MEVGANSRLGAYSNKYGMLVLEVPCEQWFLQAGRYASMGKKVLRATVCFSIEHARPRDDYEYATTRRQRELQHFLNKFARFFQLRRVYFNLLKMS